MGEANWISSLAILKHHFTSHSYPELWPKMLHNPSGNTILWPKRLAIYTILTAEKPSLTTILWPPKVLPSEAFQLAYAPVAVPVSFVWTLGGGHQFVSFVGGCGGKTNPNNYRRCSPAKFGFCSFLA